MIKKHFKLLIVIFMVLTVLSCFSFCFAEETNEVNTETTAETTTEETSEEEVYKGDLYIVNSTVTMDKLVDGNVYIIANDVTVSGQVNGNLFVLANSINFDNCYVRYSIYACANNIYYNGACNDLYSASQKLEMTYDSYVVRDVKAISNNTIFKAAIGRDVDLQTNSVDFGSEKEVPVIYGNLRYSANQEKQLAEGIVEGDVHYQATPNINNQKSIMETVKDILFVYLKLLVVAIIAYALLSKFKPDIMKQEETTSPVTVLKCLAIGFATLIVGCILAVLLCCTGIGIPLAGILACLLVIVGILATPIAIVKITNLLKPVLKIEKNGLYYLVLALVTVVVYGLSFIPYAGGCIDFFVFIFGYGLIVNHFLPKKNLTEEEIQKKLAAKEAKKALKEEKKANKKTDKKSYKK